MPSIANFTRHEKIILEDLGNNMFEFINWLKTYLQKLPQCTADPYTHQIKGQWVPTPTQFAMIFQNLGVRLQKGDSTC